jgi:hypothetical protein
LLLPVPDAPDEGTAAEVATGLSLGFELPLDHDLRSDSCVIGPDHPVGIESAHAVIPDERIHEGLLECVPHVQGAGNVGWGQLNAIGRVPLCP